MTELSVFKLPVDGLTDVTPPCQREEHILENTSSLNPLSERESICPRNAVMNFSPLEYVSKHRSLNCYSFILLCPADTDAKI